MTTIDLDNTLYKIDLVASFNNATEINTLKNTFSVNWNLNHLKRYNKQRIFLILDNAVIIPQIENNGGSVNDIKSVVVTAKELQFRNRVVGQDLQNFLFFFKGRTITSNDTDMNLKIGNEFSNNRIVYELESVPDKTITFELFDSSKNASNIRPLLETTNNSSFFKEFDLQFSLIIMKSLK